jgi:cell division protease FtsH
MVYAENEGEVFLGRSVTRTSHISEATQQKVDAEVRALIDTQYKVAETILKAQADKVEVMTAALMEFETIDADQIQAIMAGRFVMPSGQSAKASSPPPATPPHSGTGAEVLAAIPTHPAVGGSIPGVPPVSPLAGQA